MKSKTVKNAAASVRQRLENKALRLGRPFQELLVLYGIERFLHRLSRTPHVKHFILKGALLLRAYDIPLLRPTRDIDLLGRIPSSADLIQKIVRECMAVEDTEDGLIFDPDSIVVTPITEEANYSGLRARFRSRLGTAVINLQLDIAFGDSLWNGPLWIEYPVLLGGNTPSLKGYPLVTVVAEKYQAMVYLDAANSRMKDFYDLYFLATHYTFEGPHLSRAIHQTFDNRKTPIPSEPPHALTSTFTEDSSKQKQWRAFVRKNRLEASLVLDSVIKELHAFIMPASMAAGNKEAFLSSWPPGGPWTVKN